MKVIQRFERSQYNKEIRSNKALHLFSNLWLTKKVLHTFLSDPDHVVKQAGQFIFSLCSRGET